MRLCTADQMRELDRRATEEFGVPSIVLMENAGIRTFDVVYDMLSEIGGSEVVIVCGKGNNGGDGFVVARHLHESGVNVLVLLNANEDDIKGDAKINLDIALNTGIQVEQIADIEHVMATIAGADLVVDALFGTGIRGEITGIAADIIDEINNSGLPVVAVDVPSGLDSDTGLIAGRCIQADATVTFALPKIGLVTYPGAAYAGDINVTEIGIPQAAFDTAEIDTYLMTDEAIAFRLPDRPRDGHKGTFGHAFLLAGSVGLTGAATMSSLSTVRIGAGLVTLGVPESLNDILEAKVTEVMTIPMPETRARSFSPAAIEKSLGFISKCDCVAIGPGIGQDSDTVKFVQELLPQIDKPMVIDADGLNAIAEDITVFDKLQAPAIITPHPGEMSRLTGTPVQEIQSNRLKAALEAAKRFGVTVVLKGAATVVANPDGEAWICPTGSVSLATGGTGDVLTGAITGFLAQGLSPNDAAICAVYIHGKAGELVAEEIGESGAAATDLLMALPKAISAMYE